MNNWKKTFSEKMEVLQEQAVQRAQSFMEHDLDHCFDEVAEFVIRWKFETSKPQNQANRRSFKFALAEDAYVLVLFKLDGVDTLECEVESAVPGVGPIPLTSTTIGLRSADGQWAETCFQAALDGFVTAYAKGGNSAAATREPALVGPDLAQA